MILYKLFLLFGWYYICSLFTFTMFNLISTKTLSQSKNLGVEFDRYFRLMPAKEMGKEAFLEGDHHNYHEKLKTIIQLKRQFLFS